MANLQPRKNESANRRHPMRASLWFVALVAITLAVAVTIVGCGWLKFGSISAALDFAQGELILVDAQTKTINGIHPGSQVAIPYFLTNNTGRLLHLIGVAPSCTCTTVQNLPLTLLPFETKVVTAQISVSETTSDFTGSMRLFTDELRMPEIVLTYYPGK